MAVPLTHALSFAGDPVTDMNKNKQWEWGMKRLERDMLLQAFAEEHISWQLLRNYLSGQIADWVGISIQDHITGCRLCSARLASCREIDSYGQTCTQPSDRSCPSY
jgi:hypothetical protein